MVRMAGSEQFRPRSGSRAAEACRSDRIAPAGASGVRRYNLHMSGLACMAGAFSISAAPRLALVSAFRAWCWLACPFSRLWSDLVDQCLRRLRFGWPLVRRVVLVGPVAIRPKSVTLASNSFRCKTNHNVNKHWQAAGLKGPTPIPPRHSSALKAGEGASGWAQIYPRWRTVARYDFSTITNPPYRTRKKTL